MAIWPIPTLVHPQVDGEEIDKTQPKQVCKIAQNCPKLPSSVASQIGAPGVEGGTLTVLGYFFRLLVSWITL